MFKTKDVLLLLGVKQRCLLPCVVSLITLCTILIVIICCLQLNTSGGRLDSDPGGGLLVIDAVR